MKKALSCVLVTGALMTFISVATAQTSATLYDLSDLGGNPTAPTPGPDDVSQLVTPSAAQSPPGLNYYFDNSTPPGQTFTTGSNTNGYILTSLSVFDADNSGGLPTAGQAFLLRIYSVSDGSNALLYATYISSNNVPAYDFYWLQWTNLGAPLQPNTQYAYSFGRAPNGSGWANIGNTNGNPYPGGEVVLIPPAGGTMIFSTTNHDYDASFDVGLTPAAALTVGAPLISPGLAVTNGTPVTVSAQAAGPGPFTYQWQTDGGRGGALTNIPGATGASVPVDTTSLLVGVYSFDVIVSNSTSVVTSSVASFSIPQAATGAALTDSGSAVSTGPNDIGQSTGGGTGDGLNYYDDNGANHGYYAGQSFTTGTNSQGYYLNSVAIETGGGGNNGTGTIQPYDLFVYEMNGATASLLAHYTNGAFSFTYGDWLVWSSFPKPLNLKPNTTYAYGFGRAPSSAGGTGWAGLNNSPTNADLYSGGQICVIPTQGGLATFGRTGNSDAVFDIGLQPIGVGPSPLPFAEPVKISPSAFVTPGTPVNLIESTTNGAQPLHYQWQTDGGSGTLTNIPGTDTTNLVVDTTGWTPGAYQYDVIVNNNFGSSTSAVVALTVEYANTTAILEDIGSTIPSPGANDIAQLNITPGGQPPGFNYYFDNSLPPGQTITTGGNPNGYTLSTVGIELDDSSGGLPSGGQAYILRIYTVSGTNATLYATYTSQTNFVIVSTTDWLRWSGLDLPLAPNTSYAYTLHRTTSGWARLANTTGDPYAGGQAVEVPAAGGAIKFSSDSTYDATFVLGMALSGYPVVAPPAFSPSGSVYAGTPVTVTAAVTGTGPFTYQWQTDNGTGTLADIPGATNAVLSVDTTTMGGLNVQYDLVAANGSGSTTGSVSVLNVATAQAPVFVSDITNSLYQQSSQLTTFVGGSVTLSDTTFQGTLPISYQWQTDGGTGTYTNIPGATNDILTLSNLQVSASGNYQLVASNSQGTGTTSAAFLTVMAQPANPFVIDFQFHTYANADVGNYSGPGVTGFGTGTYWNQVPGSTASSTPGAYYTSSSGFSDDGVTNQGISWTLFSDNSWGYTSTPVIPLLDSAANAYGTNRFQFTLPNGLYNLVLFSCGGTQSFTNNQGTLFTVNGVSQTAMPTQDTNFVQNDTYVVFNHVGVSDNTLTGTWARIRTGAGNNYGSLNGAQLQYLGPLVLLNIQPAPNGQLTLQWSQGTLLESTNVLGPWVTNSAPSPYTVTPAGAQKFYRIRVQ